MLLISTRLSNKRSEDDLPSELFAEQNFYFRVILFESVIAAGSTAKVHFRRTGSQFINSILEEKTLGKSWN